MPNLHAVLSASSSHRWLECPPSAKLNAAHEDTVTKYAAQGTDAHTLCQYRLEQALGRDTSDPTENLTYYDEEMEDCAYVYAEYVMEQIAEVKKNCSDPVVLIEQRLDFSKYVPDGFGTGDCVIISDGTLYVIDFKYGVGVLVEAEENPQMMCYALGALELFDGIYDIEDISMTIFQPRRENISTHTISKKELLEWADSVLAPTARLAANGEGEFKAGNHCRFCGVKATCRKRAEYNLTLAQYDFAMPETLEDPEIEVILEKADELISWANDVKEYALNEALGGREWNGYKIVEGRSNRRYVNENAAAEIVKSEGYDPFEHKILGITAMTKLLGKTKFEKLLGGLLEKPQGKPTLVKKSDKRPAMNISKAAKAAEDFKEAN